jgi:RNA polymerase sigma-70 factor, ECF subfamily
MADDTTLIEALRAGDEAAFATLIDTYHASLLRLAQHYTRSRAVAEEVVQETWLGVLQGIDRFEARSSLKTWIFRILMNRAMRRGQQEARTIPFSSAFDAGRDASEPAVDPSRFLPDSHPQWPNHWDIEPRPFSELPDEKLVSKETRAVIQGAIDDLPPAQREVITLRDVDGWSAAEVCNVLDLTETNQRVLLHRARSKVRRALESYLEESPE